MMMTLDAVIAVVAHFVTRTRGAQKRAMGADTKLFQEGLLDSFGVVELSAELERAAGAPIPEGELIPDDFESPRTLFERLQQLAG
jgi:acyl carrier protein